MARETTSGLGVNTRYGPISLPDGARGDQHSQSGLRMLVADWSAALINSDSINAPVTVLSNCLITRAWVEVETALSLSGTSACLCIGKEGAILANGASITGTSVGVGFRAATQLGLFLSGITATTTIVVGISSGSINEGAGRFFVEYMKV